MSKTKNHKKTRIPWAKSLKETSRTVSRADTKHKLHIILIDLDYCDEVTFTDYNMYDDPWIYN